MPTRRQLLQKIVLNANVTSVSFSNIPGNYTDLKLVSSARTDRGNNGDSMYIRFNGDTAANYANRSLYGTGGTAVTITITSPTGIALTQGACGNSDTANTFGNSEAHIPNYTGSAAKCVTHRGTNETNAATSYMSVDSGLWTGTAAIASMTLVPGNGTNFLAGSAFYLYGITHVPIINGGEVSILGGFKYHTFRSTSTLQVVEPGDVEYLVVAGGGGSGDSFSGGGGAGGYRSSMSGLPSGGGAVAEPKLRLNAGLTTVTVGAGGAKDVNGGNSSLSTITSLGGGRGGGGAGGNAGTGGSGGGGGPQTINPTAGSGTAGQGFNGGSGSPSNSSSAGGGGAGGVGQNSSSVSPPGGVGVTFTPLGLVLASGGAGNAGGPGTAGVANTGNGSAGAYNAGQPGAAGGSGIVVIRYPYDGN